MTTPTPSPARRDHHPGICAALAVTLTAVSSAFAAEADVPDRIRIRALAAPQSRQSGALGRNVYPAPIQGALELLQWAPDKLPVISVVEVRPADVNMSAEGWIMRSADGIALPTIYVAGWSSIYRAALEKGFGSRHLIVRLAGVLAHERAHIDHGPDEERAYAAQLLTLQLLSAPDVDVTGVRRAMETVRRQKRAVR